MSTAGFEQEAAYAVFAALLCTICWRSLGTWCGYRWLTAPASNHITEHQTPFVILLPALREQGLVDDTLTHFAALEYPHDLFRVVIVATAREREEREVWRATLDAYAIRLYGAEVTACASDFLSGHLPEAVVEKLLHQREAMNLAAFKSAVLHEFAVLGTTSDQVRAKLAAYAPLVTLTEAPSRWRYKAGQVRYAIESLDELLGDWPLIGACRYVAVYDFDGRPASDSLRRASEAAGGGAPLLQQPGLTVPMGKLRGRFATLDGQLHSRFALRLELWMRLVDRPLRRLGSRVGTLLDSSMHTVGNGLFIDRTQLAALGGIPSPVDDLALGWRAADTGQRVSLVRAVVYYDAYRSRREAAHSRAFICQGYLLALRDPLRLPHNRRVARGIHRLRVGARLLQWTYGPLLRLLLLALLAVRVPALATVALVMSYGGYLFDTRLVQRLWRVLPRDGTQGKSPGSSWVTGPVALLWYGEGARRAVWTARRGQPVSATTTTKTER